MNREFSKSQACFNLGRKEKKKRIFAGVLSFAAAAALAIYFVFHDASVLFRILVFPLFFLSILCFLQAKEKTCVLLAVRRERVLDEGWEKIVDAQLNRQLWIKSQKILLQAFLLALALTVLCSLS